MYVDGYVGYEVTGIEEVVNAKNAGLTIIDTEGYSFTYEIEDEDGMREPTDEEVTERIQDALKSKSGVYAAFYLDCGTVVPDKPTTLQSEYYIGDKVYYMDDNKIYKATINTIQLAISDNNGIRHENRLLLKNGEVRCEKEVAKSPAELAEKLVANAEERGI